MFRYPKQTIVDLNDIKIGGQPGENSPLVIGTIFYEGHNILKNSDFDKEKAEALIQKHLEAADNTKLPCAIDVFGSDSLNKQIDFVADLTKNPIFIDSQNSKARISALNHIDEIGLSKRVVYNSINMAINNEEIEALKNSKIESSLILAYNITDSSLQGKLNALESNGAFGKGFITIAKECGIKNILIDTAMTPLYHGAGISLKSIISAKAKFGYPTGCAIHNAVSEWKWIQKREAFKTLDIGSNILPVLLGADFVLYGPIENSTKVFDLVAFAHILVQEGVADFVDVKKLEL